MNPPEGFNLRRDVYIRMASLVKTLRKEGDDWVLVLPPWGRLYHWQSPNIHQIRIPWGEFFSLTSLQANVPVIEYEEFIAGELLIFVTQTGVTFSERFSFIWHVNLLKPHYLYMVYKYIEYFLKLFIHNVRSPVFNQLLKQSAP